MMNYSKLLQFPELDGFTARGIVLLLACACYSLLIECKNGHPFVVTEVSIIIIIIMQLVNYMYSSILCLKCGRPMQLTNCRECGEPIGGRSHKLTKGNVEYKG